LLTDVLRCKQLRRDDALADRWASQAPVGEVIARCEALERGAVVRQASARPAARAASEAAARQAQQAAQTLLVSARHLFPSRATESANSGCSAWRDVEARAGGRTAAGAILYKNSCDSKTLMQQRLLHECFDSTSKDHAV